MDPNEESAESGRKTPFGVLFVHGIGEQARGDTLLEFADPLIEWLTRWRETVGDSVGVLSVSDEQNSPVSAILTCQREGAPVDPSSHMLLAETWWADKFRPPPTFELAWWLLLIGTWATVSHAAKPLVSATFMTDRIWLRIWHTTVAVFRAAFYYTPLALSYQLAVLLLGLVGAIPIGPWRSMISELLLKLSRTLGDSYVLLHSPIQRRYVIDAVRRDILAMQQRCDRVMVIAHSQGAAITYYALKGIRNSAQGDQKARFDCFRPEALSYVSVGSGLDKLDDLRALDAKLSYRVADDTKRWQNRVFYVLPIAFLGVWLPLVAWWYGWGEATTAFSVLTSVLLGIWVFAAAVMKRQRRSFSVDVAEWHDILATSDPVSNGRVSGPEAHVIVNERSLLKDHTTYFDNATDFAPTLVSLMASFSKLPWLQGTEGELLDFRGRSRRDVRKQFLVLGKWANRIGAIVFLWLNTPGFTVFRDRLYSDILAIVSLKFTGLTWSKMLWLHAVLVFVAVDIALRWTDRTNDRTETNLLFSRDGFLWYLRALLTALSLLLPVAAWIALILK